MTSERQPLMQQVQAMRTHQRLLLLGHLALWGGIIWAFRAIALLDPGTQVSPLPLLPITLGLLLLLTAQLRRCHVGER